MVCVQVKPGNHKKERFIGRLERFQKVITPRWPCT